MKHFKIICVHPVLPRSPSKPRFYLAWEFPGSEYKQPTSWGIIDQPEIWDKTLGRSKEGEGVLGTKDREELTTRDVEFLSAP